MVHVEERTATSIGIAAFANADDVLVCWRIEASIPACLGFALEREVLDANEQPRRSWVENRVGFKKDDPRPGERRASTQWPFQRFSWTDHLMNAGDRVRYRVTPVRVDDQGSLYLDTTRRSEWSDRVTLSPDVADGISCYFNRGLVISQFMSRYLDKLHSEKPSESRAQTLKRFKGSLSRHEEPIRKFLSGDLGNRLVDLLKEAKEGGGSLYAALYELEDEELVKRLGALGSRAHVVLANGSVKKEKGKWKPSNRDQNAGARKRLKKAGVDVRDRMVAPAGLGHNKFVVLCDGADSPRAVWTGSTNWTKTGLCTQINNGVLIEDRRVARVYREQWDRLADARSGFPRALTDSNDSPKPVQVGSSRFDVWFTRTSTGQDATALKEAVEGAREAILFHMFMPGSKGLFRVVDERAKAEPDLYVHGVVSDLPEVGDESAANVRVMGTRFDRKVPLKIVQPEGIKTPFSWWAETVTRGSFKANIGHAIVHSKLVVLDPFTNPVVITGSHNFSQNASTKNDENFVIVRGNAEYACACAVHLLSVYAHYRWLANVAEKQVRKKPLWDGLEERDAWQQRHLHGASGREMRFWVR